MKKTIIYISAFALSSLFWSCESSDNKSNEDLLQQMMDSSANETAADVNALPEEAIEEILKQIPSPIETSVIIKKTGADFDKSILNSSENAKNYNSNYKRALNLGVYGADLGYINIYEQNKESLYFLNSVKNMADGLSIGQFFDIETIKRMVSNNSNADSLLNITTENFNKINSYLYEQKRSDQSVLILTGGWIEGLNIMCQVSQKTDEPRLRERIGEQKIIIDMLVLVLANYEKNASIKELSADVKQLKDVYDKIEIKTTYKDSKTEIIDGIPTIVNQSETEVIITDDQLNEIRTLTSQIRNKIVS